VVEILDLAQSSSIPAVELLDSVADFLDSAARAPLSLDPAAAWSVR
jgi:hypothetical protein